MKTTETIEEIMKTENKEEIEYRLKCLFKSYCKNQNLIWLLEEKETPLWLVMRLVEATHKGLFTLSTTFVERQLSYLLRKKKTLKRKATFIQLTEELKMFSEDNIDPIELLEQYDYIRKTFGENYAKYLVTGEFDLEDLQQAEGISRATLFRKLKQMREANEQ